MLEFHVYNKANSALQLFAAPLGTKDGESLRQKEFVSQ